MSSSLLFKARRRHKPTNTKMAIRLPAPTGVSEFSLNSLSHSPLACAALAGTSTGNTPEAGSDAGVAAKIVKGHGEVVPTILDTIKKEGLDLLVVGGKGRSSLSDLILGSVTTKLISLSPIPVLVVK